MGGLVFKYQYGLFSSSWIVGTLSVPVIVFLLIRLFTVNPFHVFDH